MIYIVGLGPGSKEYMLYKAVQVLSECEIILGFKRAVDSLDFIATEKVCVKSLSEILNFIVLNPNKNIAIAASGDPCFYGISDYIKENYAGELQIIPGISSFQYLTAKLNKSWQQAHLGSLHGREEELIEKVREKRISIWLTDRKNSPQVICSRLIEDGLNFKVYVGENLSYNDEKVTEGYAKELVSRDFNELSVVVIENDLL